MSIRDWTSKKFYGAFTEYGQVKSVRVNLDQKTGLVKGYAMVDFENFADAQVQ